jgi:Tol biopolymer transport system component
MDKHKVIFTVGVIIVVLVLVGGLIITGVVPIKEKGTCNQPEWLTAIQRRLGGGDLQQIAFETSSLEYPGEIFIINEDGSGLHNLTNHPAYDHFPVWSPDGQKLLFVSHRSGNPDIFVMDANGDNVRQLTDSEREDFDPEWSLDGCQIVYTSTRIFGGGYWEADVFLMNADGSNKRNLTDNQDTDNGAPSWVSDGQEILYLSNHIGETFHMVIMDLNGNILRSFDKSKEFVSISPDGMWVLYISRDIHDLYLMDIFGQDTRKITSKTGRPYTWLPDGSKFAFWASDVIEIDMNTLEERVLYDVGVYDIQYSPDGHFLAFTSLDGKDYDLFLLNLDTMEVTQLTNDDLGQDDIAWRP